ncbi:MAG: iron-containing alcohol dehydrogenase [Proteobacteria bacterium]|nr:iron-containing alcohol dehydrogenase [Desulfobacula sp.]MBU3954457.1 iron-containing alcohol dehydrogenase [Pseudomonadota bacterium]MBU4133239.1 iron-containing alcohol dehydrogenase [Pseudomonadota bacterium]
MNTGNFTFLCPCKTLFGLNALAHLPFDLSAMGCHKPLVLLDKDAQLAGCTKPLARAFKESGMTLGICPPMDKDPNTSAGQERGMLKELYHLYRDKGFDAIIALGTGNMVDMAKALNMTVTLGPDCLKSANTPITRPLSPFVYIPTGMGTGMETCNQARFNSLTFTSVFLMPDLVLVDPKTVTKSHGLPLVDAALTCLSVCCQAHALSDNPPARAYAATGIGLIMENFLPLATHLMTPGSVLDKQRAKRLLANLAHASAITGIILANCAHLPGVGLGSIVAGHCTATPGQAMAILLPSVLDLLAKETTGQLLLHLSGPDAFAATPSGQRPALAIQSIQALLNALYRISLGTLPRTLGDAGLDKAAIPELSRAIDPRTMDPKQAEAVLTYALDGRPRNLS